MEVQTMQCKVQSKKLPTNSRNWEIEKSLSRQNFCPEFMMCFCISRCKEGKQAKIPKVLRQGCPRRWDDGLEQSGTE